MEPKELIESFIQTLITPNALIEDVMKHLTVTQQNEAKYINRINPVGIFNGLYSMFIQTEEYNINVPYNSNKVMRDAYIKVKYNNSLHIFRCRLIKEIGVRKTGEEGQWGININSFRNITGLKNERKTN